MADEYCSTFARALGLLRLPAPTDGVGHRKVRVAELTNTGRDALRDGDGLNDRQKSLLEALERDGPTVAATLGTPALRRLQKRGLVDVGPQHKCADPSASTSGCARVRRPRRDRRRRTSCGEVPRPGVAPARPRRGRRTRAQPDVQCRRGRRTWACGGGAHVDETALLQAAKRRGPERVAATVGPSRSSASSSDFWRSLRRSPSRSASRPVFVSSATSTLRWPTPSVCAGSQEQAQRTRERRAVLIGHPARQLDQVGRHTGRQHRVGLGEPVGIELDSRASSTTTPSVRCRPNGTRSTDPTTTSG